MRLKVSECAALQWQRGRLVWDDYLGHQQFVLAEAGETLCRAFREWADPLAFVNGLPLARRERTLVLIEELVDKQILVREGSERDHDERALLASWTSWGLAARHFHYASRTLTSTPYVELRADYERLRRKAEGTPPPDVFPQLGGPEFVGLPGPDSTPWSGMGFGDVLYARRTTRQFSQVPLEVEALGALLSASSAPSPNRERTAGDQQYGNVFKTSPSGGARHPLEVFVHVTRVSGVRPGLYHYSPLRAGLEPVGGVWSMARLSESVGGQTWMAEGSVMLYYVAYMTRVRWKYDFGRVYRVLLLDLGHLSQTVYLTATALGLGVAFTAATRDEPIEMALGCKRHDETVLGATAIGVKATSDPITGAFVPIPEGSE